MPTELRSKGKLEREAIEAFYKVRANRGLPPKPKFGAYKLPAVKDALERAFGGKCAYCETSYRAAHPVDIEHYRPKSAYTTSPGKLSSLGYYWLAADWKNLLPSCIDCNRRRKQKLRGGVVQAAGKANLFPLANETTRAKRPGQEGRERPLLLNPCDDQPSRHLLFDDNGHVDPLRRRGDRHDPRGEASILVYGLERDGLVRERRGELLNLQKLFANFQLAAEMLDLHPGDARAEALLRQLRADIESHADPMAPYSEMARQAIERWRREMTL